MLPLPAPFYARPAFRLSSIGGNRAAALQEGFSYGRKPRCGSAGRFQLWAETALQAGRKVSSMGGNRAAGWQEGFSYGRKLQIQPAAGRKAMPLSQCSYEDEMFIDGVYTHNARNDALFWFHSEFKSLVEKHENARAKIAQLFEAYLQHYLVFDEGLKKINKSALTRDINNADKERDIIWYGMERANEASLTHYDPEVAEAAYRVGIVLKTYGNVPRMRFNEQTSAIYNILQEFEGRYAADIATAGLTGWVAQLRAKNAEFDRLMKERFEESAAKPKIDLKKVRADINAAFRAIKKRMNAVIEYEGTDEYDAFASNLNEIIRKHHIANSRPRKLAKKDEAKDAPNKSSEEQEEKRA